MTKKQKLFIVELLGASTCAFGLAIWMAWPSAINLQISPAADDKNDNVIAKRTSASERDKLLEDAYQELTARLNASTQPATQP